MSSQTSELFEHSKVFGVFQQPASACAIVLTMKASPTSVFPHRGLARYQFTPMSGAHKALETTEFCASVSSLRLSVLMAFPSVSQFGRSVMK